MKYLYAIFSFLIITLISSCGTSRYYQTDSGEYYQQQPDYQHQSEITYQQFYNDLSPYGNWVNYGNYGYAWIPNQSNFRPYYSNGRWAYTNYGWTWVSNYNWGWAPFHYGRWVNDMMYGWMWIPGYEWAPAWVSWRGGGNYYGWAPLGPNMDANISAGSIPYNDWTFVPGRYMSSSRMNNYFVRPSDNITIINRTTIINNTTAANNGQNNNNMGPRRYYNAGPSAAEVERATGAPIRKFNVVEANKPSAAQINNNSIRVFRPAVNQQPSTNGNASPPRLADINQIRQMHPEKRPANRQNNQQNNQQNPPAREFPKDQTPQILRDDPPIRDNNPGLAPGRNNQPARRFRNNNNQQQEMTPGSQQTIPSNENPNRTNTPVRTFKPHNEQQNVNRAAEQPPQPQVPANQNLNRNNNVPERNFHNDIQTPPQQNIYKRNENEINRAPSTQSQPVRTFTPDKKDQ